MINITLTETLSYTDLVVKGHAEYNSGNDIVCSAVSCLVCTYADLVRSNDGSGAFMTEHKLNEGNSRVTWTGKSMPLSMYTDFIHKGFSLLEEAFPDHVKLEYKRI